MARDNHALKYLDAFFAAFDDLDMHLDGVPRSKIWDVLAQLHHFYALQNFHC